ncbi:triacylglycerol lipase [Cytidiella melzeri]|nr:triacylglycerol lipase [Cytidiella melzeri]
MRSTVATLLFAASLNCDPALAVAPLVDVGYTKYHGSAGANGITQWLGIRYAAPPLGGLRYAAPTDPPVNRTTQIADQHGSLCFSTGAPYPESGHSEDCLFLDVYAPTSARVGSKLPVVFQIPGGGLNSLSPANLNGSQLIQAAEMKAIVVTHNYRVGSFGFLPGKEVHANGTLNAGLLDQRKAMQWVQKHIASFGGDPGHIVLSGSSAGAQSITVHLTAYGGKPTNLFQGVAAESLSFPELFNITSSQFMYDGFVERTGCAGTADTLACLRGSDVAVLQNASVDTPLPGRTNPPNFLYGATIDGDLIPEVPFKLWQGGKIVNVPAIFGADNNDGTVFTPTDLNTVEDMDNFLLDNWNLLNQTSLDVINNFYPVSDQFPNHGEFYFNAATAYGELRYACFGILASRDCRKFNTAGTTWLYHYNVQDPAEIAAGLGTPHTIELVAIWGTNSGAPVPASYLTTNKNIIPIMQGYWTSFIRTLNPNTFRAPGAPEWVAFDGNNRILLETNTTRMETIDPVQQSHCNFFWQIATALQQ